MGQALNAANMVNDVSLIRDRIAFLRDKIAVLANKGGIKENELNATTTLLSLTKGEDGVSTERLIEILSDLRDIDQ